MLCVGFPAKLVSLRVSRKWNKTCFVILRKKTRRFAKFCLEPKQEFLLSFLYILYIPVFLSSITATITITASQQFPSACFYSVLNCSVVPPYPYYHLINSAFSSLFSSMINSSFYSRPYYLSALQLTLTTFSWLALAAKQKRNLKNRKSQCLSNPNVQPNFSWDEIYRYG
jgi:hypothetical protein